MLVCPWCGGARGRARRSRFRVCSACLREWRMAIFCWHAEVALGRG